MITVSNIAWPTSMNSEVAALLRELQVSGIEVAPTKLFSRNLMSITPEEIRSVRDQWAVEGLSIVAAQALLFGRPELTLFHSDTIRHATSEYLKQIIRLAAALGAGPLVFGSPKNRRRGPLSHEEAVALAIPFFRELGEVAVSTGSIVVLEANPVQYGADFITTAGDAIEFVIQIDHPGVGLHLDTACMHLAGDSVEETIERGALYLKHFHVSEPDLHPIRGEIDHACYSRALRSVGYKGRISLEMRETNPFDITVLRDSILRVMAIYDSR